MFLRCERCRAIYVLDAEATAAPPVVACSRCAHVFVARSALTDLSVRGTLGGAAAEEAPEQRVPATLFRAPTQPDPAPAWPLPERLRGYPAAVAPQRRAPKAKVDPEFQDVLGRRRSPMIIGVIVALAVLAAVGWLVRHRVSRATRTDLPSTLAASTAGAEAALERDDDASLESAIAAFADAEAKAPDHPEIKAWRGFATLLAGASLMAEAADLGAELVRLERELRAVSQIEPVDEARKAALADRMAEIRQRIGPATTRAEKLVREGAGLVKAVAGQDGLEDAPPVLRGLALFYATNQDTGKLDALARATGEDVDPWIIYAQGYARTLGRTSGQKAQEARRSLEAALAKRPDLLRAKWDLARLALVETPPALDRAKALLDEVLARNPRHDGARRGLDAIAAMRAPPAQAEFELGATVTP